MSSLPAQPLEVSDFSGGITENFVQSDPRRYASADNFLITVDKKLLVRPAFLPLAGTASQLPTGAQRVTGMYAWINETILVAQSERNFYYYDPINTNWNAIAGVAGNPVLSGASIYAQTSYSEFQKLIYVTSDGGIDPNGSYPVKFYKNSTDAWTAVTAGLPRAYSTGTYTLSSLVAACVLLANDLRQSMIAHFGDAYWATYTTTTAGFNTNFLHANIDKVSLQYLTAQTFVVGDVATNTATPAPAATDINSLFTLVGALCNAFYSHTTDAYQGSFNQNQAVTNTATPVYHYPIQFIVGVPPVKGPIGTLSNLTTPTLVASPTDAQTLTALTTAAAQLDDLKQKWYWHRLSINTHSKYNIYSSINKYATSVPAIGRVSVGNTYPTITPDYTDFINFANNLKSIFQGHTGKNGPHTQPPTSVTEFSTGYVRDTNVNMPNATDLDSSYLLLYWLRAIYYIHYLDASTLFFSCGKIDTNAAVNTTNNLLLAQGATSLGTPYPGYWFYCPYPNDFSQGFALSTPGSDISDGLSTSSRTAQIIASDFGSPPVYTYDRSLGNALTRTFVGQFSKSWYHFANLNGQGVNAYTGQTATSEALASPTTVGSDLSTWVTLGTELFNCLAAHAFNTGIHTILSSASTVQDSVGNTTLVKGISYATYATWNSYSLQACATPFFIPTVATYSWGFTFAHNYTVGINGVQYLVQSNPVYTGVVQAPVSYPANYLIPTTNTAYYQSTQNPAVRSTVLSNLPTLANTNETNYDTANVKLRVYRTINAGTTYYLEQEIANGTTTFTDSASDTVANASFGVLSLQTPIYTTGGVIGSDQPPKCKYTHILNGTAYYGAIYDSGQFFPQRVRQAVQGAPDWAPATFTDDLDDDLTGLSSAKDLVIAFCKNSIARLQGGSNSQGQGLLTHLKISDSLGALNAKSIVRTEIGVFFAGNDGFYYTDGFQIIKISLELDVTYQKLTGSDVQKRSIYGAYDKTTRRVWWSMKQYPNDSENSIFYIFYLDYGVKPSGVFTTASNFPYMRPSSHVFVQGVLYWGHEQGYVLFGDKLNKADAIVNTAVAPASWQRVVIPFNYTSCAVDVGSTFKRKWLTKVHVIAANVGNIAFQMNAIRDMNFDYDGVKPLSPGNYTDNMTWGNSTIIWKDATQHWNNTGKVDLWRRFPQTALRADLVQLQFKPAKIAVYASSIGFPTGANAVVDAVAKTATIQTPSGYSSILWPNDVAGYVIAFSTDGYVNEFTVASLDVTKKIITYTDAGNLSVSAPSGVTWVIRGLKKEQAFELSSYTLHYAYLGDKVQAYPGSKSNAGAGNAGENPS